VRVSGSSRAVLRPRRWQQRRSDDGCRSGRIGVQHAVVILIVIVIQITLGSPS
jgi:hypothetical protein